MAISEEDDHRVTEAAKTSITCDGGGVHIEAAVQATVSGDCDDIDVDGAILTAEEARDLEVEGSDDTVSYEEGSPKVEDDGSGNSVSNGCTLPDRLTEPGLRRARFPHPPAIPSSVTGVLRSHGWTSSPARPTPDR